MGARQRDARTQPGASLATPDLTTPELLRLLGGGDRRSTGRSEEVAARVREHPALASHLVAGLAHDDEIIRMRSADALEKASTDDHALLAPHKTRLLEIAANTRQIELRWHLAQMLPRLPLDGEERARAERVFTEYLDDVSSIVRTCAMEALTELAALDEGLMARWRPALQSLTASGTPAMRARGRKLLRRLARPSRAGPRGT